MFGKFFEWLRWNKKEEVVSEVAGETPKEEASKSQPFTIPDSALMYKSNETYVPYQGPVDRELEKLFEVTKEAPKTEEPISDPPPSMDFLNKPSEVKVESEVPADPMVNTVVTELSKEDVKTKLSSKKSAPRKKKKKPVDDDLEKTFANLLKKLAEEDKPKKAKKKAVKKTVKKKAKK